MFDDLYPQNWPELARAIKEANNWRCSQCGLQCRRPGEMYLGWQYELTIAHYDHVYATESVFVTALCVRCHFAHDCRFVWRSRRRAEKTRRQRAGQLLLLTVV